MDKSAAQDRLAKLEAAAAAAERYLAASNTLAFRPTKEIETAAAQAHHDLTEALNAAQPRLPSDERIAEWVDGARKVLADELPAGHKLWKSWAFDLADQVLALARLLETK